MARASSWTVGVDFGGTYVKLGLVDQAGRVRHAERLASQTVRSPGAFIEGVSEAVERLGRRVGVRPLGLRGVGVGAPGPIDGRRGIVHNLVNVPGWQLVPLKQRLERRLRCPCAVDNDANLYILGEARFGAGRGAKTLVGLTLGTGVGGGIVLDGRVFRGAVGAAAELGHMVIDPQGARCGCGARGCLESHVGTAAILRLARSAVQGRARILQRLMQQPGARLTPELVCRAADLGDASARAIWQDVGRWLGIGVANLVNILNPDVVVIGGGVANAWRHFAPALRVQVRRQALELPRHSARIVRSQRGNEAGIVGAAVLVWNEMQGGQARA
ncbi:MAG: transcriptional regulator [Candidatus Omnitrophica bacterium CG11_big_fil_rev_8_21_14_0_20_63_9]|nr:MAG: transcriptional regulator [Candidatus Omnitrophica bacterium CG11_big_fil_rev_8_21_14_0_20_63_9]